jgi:hypothetical protein
MKKIILSSLALKNKSFEILTTSVPFVGELVSHWLV